MSKLGEAPAFPVINQIELDGSYVANKGDVFSNGGMTLRQYFAAMAMQGAVSNPQMIPRKETMRDHARGWIAAADALLAELEKEKAQ